jgi:hypothetical protein
MMGELALVEKRLWECTFKWAGRRSLILRRQSGILVCSQLSALVQERLDTTSLLFGFISHPSGKSLVETARPPLFFSINFPHLCPKAFHLSEHDTDPHTLWEVDRDLKPEF